MKKYILIAVIVACASSTLFAQNEAKVKKKNVEVPSEVLNAFAKKFPGAKAKWDKENDHFEGEFKQQGHEMSALFDANGTLLETEMEIRRAELPASVASYVAANYQGERIKESSKITMADGEINYEAEVNGKDLIFDSRGKFLKEIKK